MENCLSWRFNEEGRGRARGRRLNSLFAICIRLRGSRVNLRTEFRVCAYYQVSSHRHTFHTPPRVLSPAVKHVHKFVSLSRRRKCNRVQPRKQAHYLDAHRTLKSKLLIRRKRRRYSRLSVLFKLCHGTRREKKTVNSRNRPDYGKISGGR